MRLAEKYAPKRLVEVVGQPEAVSQMLLWLADWKRGKSLIIHGPTGTGKTAAVRALAAEKNFELVEIGNEENLESRLAAVKQHSLLRRQKLVVVEDAEQLPARTLSSIVKESVFPVIIFAEDVWSPKFVSLRAVSEVIQFRKIHRSTIEKRLAEVRRAENLPETMKVGEFAEAAAGDMRAALIDIDSGSDAVRDRTSNVFETLRMVFQGTHAEAAAALEKCEKDPHQFLWWVEENITVEFKDPEERARAFELLSRADLTKRYALLSGICTARKKKSRSFTSYRPPRFLRKGEVGRLAAAMHCSPRTVRKEMPFLKRIL